MLKISCFVSFVCASARKDLAEINIQPEFERLNDFATIINRPTFFCNMIKTNTLLGYEEKTNNKIYKNDCTGFCLSQIKQPHECVQTKEKIRVYQNPNSFNRKISTVVTQVTDCQCKPKRCQVEKLDFTQYIEHGNYYYDNCNRKCKCSYGRLVDCCRQRKSFTSMNYIERKRYIDTLIIVSTTAPYKTQYDNLINKHQTLFGSGIHSDSRFLPWHRYYILELENLLQQVDCRVTVPYWDWVSDSTSPMVGHPWTNSNSWLGGDGDDGGCVTTGPFAFPSWTLPNGQCLRRNFNVGATMATLADVQTLYNNYPDATASDYNGIRVGLESGPGMHNTGHCIISGTACTSGAAAAPEFFMHHCNIDKLWADWQAKSPMHVNAYSGNLLTPMPGTGIAPVKVMNLNNQPDNVKVCYIKPRKWTWFTDILQILPQQTLTMLPKTVVTPASKKWLEMLGEDVRRIRKLERKRNSGNNVMTQEQAMRSNAIVASIGVDLGKTLDKEINNIAVVGCIDNEFPPDIDDRCDEKPIFRPNLNNHDSQTIEVTGLRNRNNYDLQTIENTEPSFNFPNRNDEPTIENTGLRNRYNYDPQTIENTGTSFNFPNRNIRIPSFPRTNMNG